MLRLNHNHSLNTAGLEADVMRFMAIIAFCLIAIMALVKKIEPAGIGNKLEANIAVPIVEVDANPALPVVKVEVEISPEPEQLKISASIPIPFIPTADREVTTAEKSSELESIVIPGVAEGSHAEPEPLTFRFDSDRTFLHLIATNNLLLYASTADGFLGMDSGFNVVQSTPAGELYEVMPKSIPRKITNIFERNAAAPIYLVALPATTKQDLSKFLASNNSQSTGTLVIHRDGHISHEI